MTTADEISAVQQSGYDYYELSGRMVAGLTEGEFDALAVQVARGRIPCLGLNAYCWPSLVIAGPGADLRAAAEYAEHLAARAQALGVHIVGIGSPGSRTLPDGYDRQTAWTQALRFFQVTEEAFQKRGILVAVEALGFCYCNFINCLEEACRIAKEVGRPGIRIIPDLYNMEHSGEADIALQPYLPMIGHMHLSDDEGDPYTRSYLKNAKEAVHLRRLRALREAGYTGTVSLEVDVPYDDIRAKQSLAMLRQV